MNGTNPKSSEDKTNPDPAGQGQWQYRPETASEEVIMTPEIAPPSSLLTPEVPQEVTWTASEFVAHSKGAGWYASLVIGAAALTMGVWLFTKDYISVFVVIIAALLLGIAASRKPRVLEYSVDRTGIEIGGKLYPYDEFKSFSVMAEGAFSSIMLLPLKRFSPPISIYYPPDDEQKIIAVIASHLPLEAREHDAIDRLAQRMRF